MRILLLSASMIAVSSSALGQTCEHYWEFSSTTDQVGGLVTTQVGSPVLGVNATYGEAFPGAGPSLNNLVNGTAGGGGHLEASLSSGGPWRWTSGRTASPSATGRGTTSPATATRGASGSSTTS
ncbi:MAG: hypothetical protein ISQ11_07950 [Planctomycetes bacterium]|nr:hypothetical protein [Planctomycetota bacterium]